MKNESAQFGKLRTFFWPIHRYELTKFIPMLILFFLVSFNYHLLRITKDSLIITAPSSGACVIPFLKVWCILPAAIIITAIFAKLSNIFSRENIFYAMVGIFIVFFTIFVTVLYPYREQLFFDSFADFLKEILPPGGTGIVAIVRYWNYALFYVFAELWSTVMFSLLMWGFANDVIKVFEAKRFYPLFGIGANMSGMIAGSVGVYLSKLSSITSTEGTSNFDHSFSLFIFVIIIVSFLAVLIHRFLHKKIFKTRSDDFEMARSSNGKSEKEKMSLKEILRQIFKSRYLMSISVIVLSYNVVINFTEVLWKSQIKELYPNLSEYSLYMSSVTFYIGILSTLSAALLSGNVIRIFGWKTAAKLTPRVLAFTGIGFFYFLFIKQYTNGDNFLITLLGIAPLTATVFFGTLQNCFGRACKYTVFDDTKEMAFIPLNPVERLKGKSAIDGIGSRLGKSGSSFFLLNLILILGNSVSCAPAVACLLFFIFPIWFVSINRLNKKFSNAQESASDIVPVDKIKPKNQTSEGSTEYLEEVGPNAIEEAVA